MGEMALFSKSLSRCSTVRCSTRVTARIVTHEQLVEYVLQQPLAKHQIREVIWKKESEITMVRRRPARPLAVKHLYSDVSMLLVSISWGC